MNEQRVSASIYSDLLKHIKPVILGGAWLCLLFSFGAHSESRFNTQKRYLYIQQGQSIYQIVSVLYPGMQKQWANIINQVVKDNPHAFVNKNAAQIKVGARVSLPAVVLSNTAKAVKKKVVEKKPQKVGEVVKHKGNAFVISTKHKKRNLHVKSHIYVGDRIFTGIDAFIRLNMIDNAKIDLRCNSEMLIEDYQMLPNANKSVIQLVKGSIKKTTGSIGKSEGDIYEMRTPVATIGVRGTEYAIRVLQQHGCDGSLDVNSEGMFVKVERGAIDVESSMDTREVKQHEVMFLADDKSLLKEIKTDNGVFEKARPVEKKRNHIGGSMWLIFLIPLGLITRRFARKIL